MTFSENLGHGFARPELLLQALTHKSHHNENRDESPGHNERLEFLGDSVLDLVVSENLFESHPDLPEGQLSRLRSELVKESTLAEIASGLHISEALRLGKGESQSGGALKPRLLASSLEAVIGALFLDCGYEKTKIKLLDLLSERLERLPLENPMSEDYKSQLQEYLQDKKGTAPTYKLIGEEGPDHRKRFYVQVLFDEEVLGEGEGHSKKIAEQEAAKKALGALI